MNEHQLTKGKNPLLDDKDSLWEARDGDGSEYEVGDLLYGVVRLIKPKLIIETGCYLGDATISMAKALKDNDYGKLVTCDIEQENVDFVKNRAKEEGLSDILKVYKERGEDLIEEYKDEVEFAFIDSGPVSRKAEIDMLIPSLKALQMFALHDTAPQQKRSSKLAESIDLPKVYFNSPRGLTLFMKQ